MFMVLVYNNIICLEYTKTNNGKSYSNSYFTAKLHSNSYSYTVTATQLKLYSYG